MSSHLKWYYRFKFLQVKKFRLDRFVIQTKTSVVPFCWDTALPISPPVFVVDCRDFCLGILFFPAPSFVPNGSRRWYGAIERLREESLLDVLALAFELPAFFALASLIFQK